MEKPTEETTTTPAEATPDTTASTTSTTAITATPKRKKAKRTIAQGQVHVQATFNNTIITVTDTAGNVLTSASAGACGFRGSKKGTAYAAQVAAEKAVNAAKQQYSVSKVDVFIKGIGLGREAAVRVLATANVVVESIKDVTGVPHGGCRPRKARRV